VKRCWWSNAPITSGKDLLELLTIRVSEALLAIQRTDQVWYGAPEIAHQSQE
jgi:hypothetical protein